MTLSHAVPDVVGEIADSIELAPRINGFHLEPRCRVCRNEQVRTKVNDMLATAASYAYIVRALAADNDKLDARDRVTIDSVRNHCERHFPVQNVAKATYRAILERRARENGIDFVEGVATALLPVTFFDIVMNKAFRDLTDDDAVVSVDTGLRAAEKLQSVLDKRDQGDDIAEMRRQVNQILDAVKTVVPQEMYEAAATIAGFAINPLTAAIPEFSAAITHLRDVLGEATHESLARKGETMTTAEMVTYAYDQIDQARTELEHPG